ncbi:MAG TPA: zinc-binding alcohol dehydrogenase family protein [Tepidisphaeraceae bacterium]|nr:zinc-binding alcohol dehydrogenase family protein [Tepidisphaeraceae bacterium]
MKAWLLDRIGDGVDSLRLAEIPDPTPAADEAIVSVEYAALNPADRYLAEGQYPAKPALPHILGRDGIGTIEAVGTNVTQFKPGDRAVILRSEIGVNRAGTFATKVAVPVESLVPPPPGWTDEQSAGAALVYLTAYQAITQWNDLPPASVVLITGASGGVGVASTQLAAAMGHLPVALSRSDRKRATLETLGANIALDPEDAEWPAQLKSSLTGRKVDLAIDNIGGPLFNDVLGTLGYHGRISVVGRLAGPVPQFNTASLFFRRIKIGGVAVGTYTAVQSRAAWEKIVGILGRAGAKPQVDSTFAFDQLKEAFARLEQGPMGKVLLTLR